MQAPQENDPLARDRQRRIQDEEPNKESWKAHWGTYAQWVAVLIAMSVPFLLRSCDSAINKDKESFNHQIDDRIGFRVDPLTEKIDGLGQRISVAEGELKAILAGRYIRESSRYLEKGESEKAIKSAERAKAALAVATTMKIPASPDYFHDAIETLDRAVQLSTGKRELSSELLTVKFALAAYRSALETPPQLTEHAYLPERTFEMQANLTMHGNDSHPERVVTDGSKLPQNEDYFRPPPTKKLSDNARVQGMTFVGASQTLDGIHWENVIFINTRIKYVGGEVELRKVLFVNCSFELPLDPRGERIANYVAQDFSAVSIGRGPT
jgi:hypothetical protein